MTREYWNQKFTEKDHFGTGPTTFAKECNAFLQSHKQNGKLLDLGCGQGRDSMYFDECGFDVTAVDFSEKALQSIPSKTIKIISHDIQDLSIFSNEEFDIVYSNQVLHLFAPDVLKKIIAEIHRILRPSGLFMFTIKNKNDKWYGKGENVGENAFLYNGVIRYYKTEAAIRTALHRFDLLQLKEDSHTMFNDPPTVYWKIFAQKPHT